MYVHGIFSKQTQVIITLIPLPQTCDSPSLRFLCPAWDKFHMGRIQFLSFSQLTGGWDNVLFHVAKAVYVYLAPSTSMLLIDRAQDHANLQARVYPVCYLINSVSTWLVAAFKARDALLTADLQRLAASLRAHPFVLYLEEVSTKYPQPTLVLD